MLASLKDRFPEDVRIVFRHFPLQNIHDKALLATQAAEAAGLQGKFWEMHDLLFERQSEWTEMDEESFVAWLEDRAEEMGLDVDQFKEDLYSADLVALAEQAWEKNSAAGVPGTPFLVINGLPYNGPQDAVNLAAIMKTILLEQKQFADCPPMSLAADTDYFATIETEKGDITIELYADRAPLAVNNFIFLASEGWYDGVSFHRVIPGFVAQAGDPSGTGFGGPGYAFDTETHDSLAFDGPGVVAMANAGPGSNGSQFFITYAPASQLNCGYTIFGRVIAGMDVVESLTPRNPEQSMELPPGDLILGVTIEEK